MLSKDGIETDSTKKFNKLFCELEECNEDEQIQKIEEMNEIVDRMNKEEFKSVFNTELFNKIHQMIEEKKLPLENAILVLKHAGYYKVLNKIFKLDYNGTSLDYRFMRMILNKETKNEGKNEKLLIDICECFAFLNDGMISPELLSVCVPCFLKFALNKEENEETQREVEIALLALSCISRFYKMDKELYYDEIKEIIEYHHEHRNLTRLAYQSAWQFDIDRLLLNYIIGHAVMNEIHFEKEATRELEELLRNMDWKKKEEEMSKEEAKDEFILMRWLDAINYYNSFCELWNEECVELIGGIVRVFRAAKDNHSVISNQCIYSLRTAAKNKDVKVEDLLNGEAVYAVLEEMQQQTLNDRTVNECLQFFMSVSNRLEKKNEDEREEVKRKSTKMDTFEKLEEEGYEDTITTFHKIFDYLFGKYSLGTSLNISDYLVNI